MSTNQDKKRKESSQKSKKKQVQKENRKTKNKQAYKNQSKNKKQGERKKFLEEDKDYIQAIYYLPIYSKVVIMIYIIIYLSIIPLAQF